MYDVESVLSARWLGQKITVRPANRSYSAGGEKDTYILDHRCGRVAQFTVPANHLAFSGTTKGNWGIVPPLLSLKKSFSRGKLTHLYETLHAWDGVVANEPD